MKTNNNNTTESIKVKKYYEVHEVDFGNSDNIYTFADKTKAIEYYNKSVKNGSDDYGNEFDDDNDYIGLSEITLKKEIAFIKDRFIKDESNIKSIVILMDK